MVDALQSCNKGTRGRYTQKVNEFKEIANSLTAMDAKIHRYLETAPRARQGPDSPSARRVHRKVSESDAFVAPVLVDKVNAQYRYKDIPGRAFASSNGLQTFDRRIQTILAPKTHDLDIQQAVCVLSYQLVTKLDLRDQSLFENEIDTLKALATDRDTFARDQMKMNPITGKEVILKTLGGSNAFSGPGLDKLQLSLIHI